MAISKVAAVGIPFLALACAVSATFAPAWLSSNGEVYQGFFGICILGTCLTTTELLTATAGTVASAVCMILGTLILFIGVAYVIMGALKSNPKDMNSGGKITIVGGCFTLIGASIFSAIVTPTWSVIFSASFVLAWVSVLLATVGGGIAIKSANEAREDEMATAFALQTSTA